MYVCVCIYYTYMHTQYYNVTLLGIVVLLIAFDRLVVEKDNFPGVCTWMRRKEKCSTCCKNETQR